MDAMLESLQVISNWQLAVVVSKIPQNLTPDRKASDRYSGSSGGL